ncbi:hypothetical protein D3C87_143850 [compost metagenome]
MNKPNKLPFHDRKIWVYYALFFAGSLIVAYQALNLSIVGDSVDLLCGLFLLAGFTIRRKSHIFENSFLMTCGYILPLLIRNTMKMTYVEAPSSSVFLELGAKSASITFALGLIFSIAGLLLKLLYKRTVKVSKGTVTTNTLRTKE